jgi:hypothetical protein
MQPGSTCGIDVIPPEPTKFEQVPPPHDYTGGIFVASGKVSVVDPFQRKVEINAPGWVKLPVKPPADDTEAGRAEPSPQLIALPKWLGAKTVNPSDRQWARSFEKKLSPDERVDLSLPAVAEDKNLARMATDALGLIEAYGALVDVLKRAAPVTHDDARRAAISALRVWLPRKPENRELLKTELTRVYSPEDAEIAYRLLWGFDQDDARNKDTSIQVLEWMEHPEVSIRELAFSHVYRLTGTMHEYRASKTPLALRNPMKAWYSQVQKYGALLPPLKDAAGK